MDSMGVYSIENTITHYRYIGQSTNIRKRWNNHKSAAFNKNSSEYHRPLYRDIRLYGLANFKLEVIESCSTKDELLARECYWINSMKPEYNRTQGIDYQAIIEKLSLKEVREIQVTLISDTESNISHKGLAEKYHVSKDTIQAINVGRAWHDNSLCYPLHVSKYDSIHGTKKKYFCTNCGKELNFRNANGICRDCFNANKRLQHVVKKVNLRQQKQMLPKTKIEYSNAKISREELKEKIRMLSFVSIGKEFGVSDRAVRKWCRKYGLPYKKSEIKNITDAEWIDV